MLLAVKDSLGALVDHLGADGVRAVVQFGPEVSVLLRDDEDGLVILNLLIDVRRLNGRPDVGPDVGRVVPIEVNELLLHQLLELDVLREWQEVLLRKIFLATQSRDLVQVGLVGILTNDVDGCVEVGAGVVIAVLLGFAGENVVIGYLHKIELDLGLLVLLPCQNCLQACRAYYFLCLIFDHGAVLFEEAAESILGRAGGHVA